MGAALHFPRHACGTKFSGIRGRTLCGTQQGSVRYFAAVQFVQQFRLPLL